jgi:lipase chaperone LimK
MRELRSNYFSDEEIAGLFGAGDAYDQDAIARLEIAADTGLTAPQRQQQLAALDAALSPAARADREAPAAVLRLEESVSAARAQGADDNEIYRLRSAALSPAAASRLAEVDREEGEWQRRIAAYQAQRRQLQQQSAGEAALQQLRDSGFSTAEQKRLPAYE